MKFKYKTWNIFQRELVSDKINKQLTTINKYFLNIVCYADIVEIMQTNEEVPIMVSRTLYNHFLLDQLKDRTLSGIYGLLQNVRWIDIGPTSPLIRSPLIPLWRWSGPLSATWMAVCASVFWVFSVSMVSLSSTSSDSWGGDGDT